MLGRLFHFVEIFHFYFSLFSPALLTCVIRLVFVDSFHCRDLKIAQGKKRVKLKKSKVLRSLRLFQPITMQQILHEFKERQLRQQLVKIKRYICSD